MRMKSMNITTCSTLDPDMSTQGIACWDFAYTTGKCSLTCGRNCISSHKKSSRSRKPQSKDDTNASIFQRFRQDSLEARTYLLSCPSTASLTYPQTYTTISTMLLQPRTQLILLVPQVYIASSIVCDISRLPRAGGSYIQVLPMPEVLALVGTKDQTSSGSESENEKPDAVDMANVVEMVRKIVKYTKARQFDGYLVFEDDRRSWTFLKRVGDGVKAASRKIRS
ncbi:hypothetical protein PV11_06835 [Exophiala sideris]|uniref:Uncharacterized protein n=1 Tax=Exophiala sideris TaxID=1016849 RepID=A0A0D1Y8M9_9EURO|nr:hypothetical protein PV11_06835 [Exophiala sideris]